MKRKKTQNSSAQRKLLAYPHYVYVYNKYAYCINFSILTQSFKD